MTQSIITERQTDMTVEFDVTKDEVIEHSYDPKMEGHWTVHDIRKNGDKIHLVAMKEQNSQLQVLLSMDAVNWEQFNRNEDWDGELKNQVNRAITHSGK